MKLLKIFVLIATLSQTLSVQAQDRAMDEQQLKAFIDFAIAASFHDEVIRSIEVQCSKYKSQAPFNDNIVNQAKNLNPEVGKLIDGITRGAKVLAQAHATQIVANANGCETENFKKSMDAIESHQAMLTIRAMQNRFR